MSEIRRASIMCACASVAALCAAMVLATASSAVTVTTVASGLDNPRALAFNPEGDLYVAEAGHGSEPAGSFCPLPGHGGPPECIGLTSGVSKIEHGGTPQRVLTGKISIAGPDGSAATGIDGVSLHEWGPLFAVATGASDLIPSSATGPPGVLAEVKEQIGRLFEVDRWGHSRIVADVGHFDFNWSKEHKELVPEQFPDANPYAVLATPEGVWVIDAASNTLDLVRDGKVRVVEFFPSPPVSDAVPTCVSRGPDGALYVGELTGGGNKPGSSVVWRIEAGHEPEVWATGLTAVTGCGWDTDGEFYAVEFSTLGFESFTPETGALVRVLPHSASPVTVLSKLSFPGGFASRGDAVYLSNWSIAPASNGKGPTGQVLRITP
ncbi:MAG TPA: ScyD/ScyE family protein [Solirubrobacteraceae bacterium]|nr:ScyD/ScyE family protein [Solirubrobacteraceae bacterium]